MNRIHVKEKMETALKNFKEKLVNGGARKLFASKAFLVSGCAVLIIGAVTVSALLGNAAGKDGTTSETGKVLGNPVLVGEDVSGELVAETSGEEQPAGKAGEDGLMQTTARNREEVRNEAMAVLRELADNPDTMPDERENAIASINAIVHDMEAEANIEQLAAARGIPQVVAVISGGKCSLIVDAEEVGADVLAQLQELVYQQSGILPVNLNVILAASPA